MTIVSVPSRLRNASLLLLLCVPLAALEHWMTLRQIVWRTHWREILRWTAVWSGSVALIAIPFSWWLMRGRRVAFYLVSCFLASWWLITGYFSWKSRNPELGFFSIALVIFFGGLLFWVDREQRRSYYYPALKWYEGLPKPIPSVHCQVILGKNRSDFHVSRIDDHGVFLFSPRREESSLGQIRKHKKLELVLSFGNRELHCFGILRGLLDTGPGMGVQFDQMTPDLKKELGDFVEALRGEGYV